MIAIITDKQIIARQIALALGIDTKKQFEGYYQSRDYMLVWTNGELVSLASQEEYGKKRITADDLPFIPKFAYSVCKQKNERGIWSDKPILKQLKLIKKVFDSCKGIIIATEPGEKGELQFRDIYHYLNCKKPFKRLWINCLTTKAIREGFANLQKGSLYDRLYAVADCRAKADFLINSNVNYALSITTGMTHYALGRLQIPVLAMICKRLLEYRKFKSSRCYELGMTLEKRGLIRKFKLSESIQNKQKAEELYEQLKTRQKARITKVENRITVQPAPLLYNLSELQKEANLRYGFSAKKTMEIARRLYEEKMISYPFTDARHIPETVFADMPKIIRQTAVDCGFGNQFNMLGGDSLNRRSTGQTDNFGHHALIPTGICLQYLPADDKLVYQLIVVRTLEAFAPDCRKRTTHMEATCGDIVLESTVSEIRKFGWRLIQYSEGKDREENEVNPGQPVTMFKKEEEIRISGCNMLTKKTRPQPLYTEATLLSAMEAFSLGTVEARTEIIETLISGRYIQQWEQNFVPAEKGLVFYNCLKDRSIADIELTESWEKALQNVGLGKQSADSFMIMLEIFTKQATEEILTGKRDVSYYP